MEANMLIQFQSRAKEIKAKRAASTSIENIESLKRTQKELVEKVINNLIETMLVMLDTLAEDNKIENFAIKMPIDFVKDFLIKSGSFSHHKCNYDPYSQEDVYSEGEMMGQDVFIDSVVDTFKTLESSGDKFSISAQCVVDQQNNISSNKVEITIKLADKVPTNIISLKHTDPSYKELQKIQQRLSSLSHSKKSAIYYP